MTVNSFQYSVCMFFREKESCVAVNLFETFKYFVAVSIELANFWQIIILFFQIEHFQFSLPIQNNKFFLGIFLLTVQ